MRAPKFEHYPADDGWRWRLKSANGEIIASGQGYATKASVLRGIRAFRRNAAGAAVKAVVA